MINVCVCVCVCMRVGLWFCELFKARRSSAVHSQSERHAHGQQDAPSLFQNTWQEGYPHVVLFLFCFLLLSLVLLFPFFFGQLEKNKNTTLLLSDFLH